MPEWVETVARVDDVRIHRFQVVREYRGGGNGDEGDDVEEWIVVGFGGEGTDDEDGSEGAIVLADRDFEWTRRVSRDAFESGRFEPLSAGGVPVWGY